MSDNITGFLASWNEGDRSGLDNAMSLMHDALKDAARRQMRSEGMAHTLQPTALVNEVYLKLSDQSNLKFENRSHFFYFAGRVMRQILVEHARAKKTAKRGSGEPLVYMEDPGELGDASGIDADTLLNLDQALTRLEQRDARQVRIVELRFFAGLSLEETAEFIQASITTVKREWTFAKRWLARELRGSLS